ncbi:hypothetical protein LX16_4220 [Stackebrandtia albiflava]|uniref:DUF1449 family protein n=1 Tax=Stackebrandtia albiflava TaxID=406432 RepID=A0A562UYV4_9ACTN|nr:hypothetical protein [Stackebrandtia albiflava]TWJ10796.1 hypothetical protein LX16_4220 [Stackebrandtia albiflava]
MGDLVEISFGFPTVVFSFAFIVVILFWLVALCGLVGSDVLDTETDTGGSSGGITGLLPVTRASRSVPVTVVLSLWIALAWFGSVAATVLLRQWEPGGTAGVLLGLLTPVFAAVLAWVATTLVVWPLGRFYGEAPAASRHDFVGRTCRIRTQTVGADFGQAEITSTDGSSAIIPVRTHGRDVGELKAGDTALVYEYDPHGEFFLVAPFDLATGPNPPVR